MPFNFPASFAKPTLTHPRRNAMTNIPMRSPSMPMPMPMDDMHRALPTSPYDMDLRNYRNPCSMNGPFGSRLGMEAPDYFSAMGMGPFGTRGRGPFPSGLEAEMYMGNNQQQIDDLVRRTNLMVQFVNGQISHAARYSQVQPKMTCDARFPPEFRVPRTVEEVRALDPSTIDRILRAYGLPADLRSLRMSPGEAIGPSTAYHAKLCTLFDFLGVTQISERQRMRRTGVSYRCLA